MLCKCKRNTFWLFFKQALQTEWHTKLLPHLWQHTLLLLLYLCGKAISQIKMHCHGPFVWQ